MHNLLLGQLAEEVERLLEVLQTEGMLPEIQNEVVLDPNAKRQANPLHGQADQKRTALGAYLAIRRLPW